jgi:UDP-N-acetylglucosamine 4,6-dehydratase
VVPLFLEQRKVGQVTITDPRMTRFWITLDQGVRFVAECIERMHGGEVFVPKIPSMGITDLAEAIAPGCQTETIGIRPGEKLHEVLISEDEARQALDLGDRFVVQPMLDFWSANPHQGRTLGEGFRYSSDSNPQKLSVQELRKLVGEKLGQGA